MAIHLTEVNRRKHSRHEKMKGFLEKKMLSLKKKTGSMPLYSYQNEPVPKSNHSCGTKFWQQHS
jgi:hypothetical protein